MLPRTSKSVSVFVITGAGDQSYMAVLTKCYTARAPSNVTYAPTGQLSEVSPHSIFSPTQCRIYFFDI